LILSSGSGIISFEGPKNRPQGFEIMPKKTAIKKRGAGRLPAAESARLVDRLLDSAQSLFTEQGFASTTMDEIARRAGSSTQTIYSRFANKTEVLEAVVRRVVETTVASHAAAASANFHGVAPRDFLLSLGRRIVSTVSKDSVGLSRLGFSESHRSPEIQRLATAGYDRGTSIIRDALEHWRDDGLVSPIGDLDRAARICLSMMTDRARIAAVLGVPMSEKETDAYVAQAVDIFLYGCAGSKR
jgi:TetR/AcrR family transcriptional repressor of mexJK operon